MREDAAFEVFAKRLAGKRLWGVVVALPIKLPRAGQLQPSLELVGYRLVHQRALRMARVVELGFGSRLLLWVNINRVCGVAWRGQGGFIVSGDLKR